MCEIGKSLVRGDEVKVMTKSGVVTRYFEDGPYTDVFVYITISNEKGDISSARWEYSGDIWVESDD